jgi:CCR4-NOT transcription complex subunit 2
MALQYNSLPYVELTDIVTDIVADIVDDVATDITDIVNDDVTDVVSDVTEARTASLPYDPAPGGGNKERSGSVGAVGTTKPNVKKPVNVLPSMVQDHYGMVGLLTFIRGAETDPNLVALALGRYHLCL